MTSFDIQNTCEGVSSPELWSQPDLWATYPARTVHFVFSLKLHWCEVSAELENLSSAIGFVYRNAEFRVFMSRGEKPVISNI